MHTDTRQTFGHLLPPLVAAANCKQCAHPQRVHNHVQSRQSRRHRDIILLAFCQPSCHIRFAQPRNKLTGATQQQWQQLTGAGAGAKGGEQRKQWGERMLPRSGELSGAHFMPHLTYIWADDDDGDDFAAQNL